MAKNYPTLTSRNLLRARSLLLKITRLLDEKGIVYHLEGGTLLGIVRDKDLLPWDHDVDISVPAKHADDFIKLKLPLFFLGYKLTVRTSKREAGPIKRASYSVFKIKPIWSYILSWFIPNYKHAIVLDVFVKTNDGQHTYWQAMDKVMRVENKYYTSFETVSYQGDTLKVPNHYKEYLTEKYGDWSIPVKDWNCGENELTIVKP